MKYVEKHPMVMIVIGVLGISLSAIFVKYSTAPSAVTAAFRLLSFRSIYRFFHSRNLFSIVFPKKNRVCGKKSKKQTLQIDKKML